MVAKAELTKAEKRARFRQMTPEEQELWKQERGAEINKLFFELASNRAKYRAAVSAGNRFVRSLGYTKGILAYRAEHDGTSSEAAQLDAKGPSQWTPLPVREVVYFIQAESGTGAIKIGFANNVASRLAVFQSGSPVRLAIVATIRGTAKLESHLHQRFAHLRLHGEWFKPEPELTEYIESLNQHGGGNGDNTDHRN